MGTYYTYISRTGSQPKVIFSVPYKDYFGLGEHFFRAFDKLCRRVEVCTKFRTWFHAKMKINKT